MGMRMPSPIALPNGVLKQYMDNNGLSAQVTLTDEADYAVAFVIVEKNA
jgi:holo-[acyl-carrier protein] synthase